MTLLNSIEHVCMEDLEWKLGAQVLLLTLLNQSCFAFVLIGILMWSADVDLEIYLVSNNTARG